MKNVPWIVYPTAGAKEIKTPWRILMLADDLNGLVNNKIIASVSDQPDKKLFPDGAKTSWIKPGRSVFTWLVEGPDRLSVANHKKYVDGAAELGLQSVVVDDGWELWPSTEPEGKAKSKWEYMSDLVNYAKAKGVDIWVWRPSSPRTGNKTDIGLNDPVERKAFMKKCAEVGIKGLKIDSGSKPEELNVLKARGLADLQRVEDEGGHGEAVLVLLQVLPQLQGDGDREGVRG